MNDVESTDPVVPEPITTTPPTQRRSAVIDLVTAFLGFLLVAVPSAIGGLFFLDPLVRGRKLKGATASGQLGDFIKLPVTPDSIPDDGTPMAVAVRTDLDDAWNRFKDVPVGSIWLRKTENGQILAFNSICPHLGCSVDYRRSENDFYCPCHTSAFGLDGQKKNEVPPRDMDGLEIAIIRDGQPDDSGDELWVKFQNFRRATADKKPI